MTPAALPRIYLIRHGETEWSRSGQHTGRSDIPLTAAGEAMAHGLAALLAPAEFTAVLTSPRQRAGQTCTLAGYGARAEIEPDLAEWDYGQYEGLRTSEIRQTVPGWNVFRDGCPGGESLAQVVARADRLLLRLRGMGGTIVLFSHGHFGCVLGARWAGLDGRAGEQLVLDPASVSILGARPGHPDVPAILRWNLIEPGRQPML